jgi:hypothetical protein
MLKITYLLLLVPLLTFAQSIKTKKDRVIIDDKEVAILKDGARDKYVFHSLDGTKQFTAKYKTLGESVAYEWLEVTSADGTKRSEVPYEVLQNSLSPTRVVIRLLAVKYELIDKNGINTQKLAQFFATDRENLSEKYMKTVVMAKEEAKATKAVFDQKVGAFRPYVKKDGTIVKGGELGTSIIGKATHATHNVFDKNDFIFITDLDGIMVAKAKITEGATNTTVVTLFNDDTFTFNAKRSFHPNDAFLFFREIVEQLVVRDYTLGHQAKTYNANIRAEKVNIAKGKSASVYNKKGYAIDEKGVKYDGILNAEFEPLDVNETGKTEVFDAVDNYGKRVLVKYLNEKGKERTTTLYAKDGARFCVKNEDGTETCFIGMKVKGDALKKLSNAMSLGFNNSYFYKLLFDAKGNQVLIDPIKEDVFVIKLKDKKEGQMIDSRNNAKLSAELSEYLATCKDLAKEIKNNVFDLKTEDNLIKIIEEFNSCK